MDILYLCIGIAALLLFGFLFLIMPRAKREVAKPLMKTPYAHRGYFGGEIPENSLPAFRAAVAHGFGIELDVQLSSDGVLMVFHDESLVRMTGVNASLHSKSYEELSALRLGESQEHIPTLAEVLALVDGKVPLLVEIKSEHALHATCEATAKLLDEYKGAYMIESFHPFAVAWFRKHRPHVVRGQLSARLFSEQKKSAAYFAVQNLLLNFYAGPDFVAYDVNGQRAVSFRLCRALYHPYTVAWTVRSKEELAMASSFDNVIFEHLTAEELNFSASDDV